MESRASKWKALWNHYDQIKKQYNLTSRDIYKQLGFQYCSSHLRYLSDSCDRLPSNREGTVGKCVWDVLIAGLSKQDWVN